jgi:uncharacterized protein (TIRG00374 family)
MINVQEGVSGSVVTPREHAGSPARDLWLERIRLPAIFLGIVAFVYVCVILWAGRTIYSGQLTFSLLNLHELPKVISLVILGVSFRIFRFYYYGRRLLWTVPFWSSTAIFIASLSLTVTPGKAGELLKSALLRAHYGTSVAESAGVLIVERLGDLLALLILASSGLLLFSGLTSYFAPSVVAVLLISVAPATIVHPLLQWSARYQRVRPLAERLMRITLTIGTLLKPEPLLIGFSLALAGWTSEAYAFAVLTQKLPVAFPLIAALSIVGLSAVVGALSMLPGGLGSVEAVMALLLTKLGVDLPSASMIVIVYRLCTIYLMTFVGFVVLSACRIMRGATHNLDPLAEE